MTTSCCAGYNELGGKHIPELKPFRSETKTPAYHTAEMVKKETPEAVTVFFSPSLQNAAKQGKTRILIMF